MSLQLRPLEVKETYECLGVDNLLDSEIFHKNAKWDVAIWWIQDYDPRDPDDAEGWTKICVPNHSVLEMLSLHFKMNFSDSLDITGAYVLHIFEAFETVKQRLAEIRIPEPSDYRAVVKYIKETSQRKFEDEEVTVAAQ